MKTTRVRAAAVALCLLSASALGHMVRPTIHLADQQQKLNLEQVIPKSFGSWKIDTSGPQGIVSPDVQAQLDKLYNQLVSRIYIDDSGHRIMLSIAYGGDQSDATRAHRPDVCYPAQGFDILSSASTSIALPHVQLPVRHLVAKQGARIEPITFWFAVGEYTAVTGQDQKIAQLRYGLRGIIPDGMLVRVSSIDNDTQAAFNNQSRFIADMSAAVDQQWAPRVFGSNVMGEKK